MYELALAFGGLLLLSGGHAPRPIVELSREDWKARGYADRFIKEVAAAVRRVAPKFGLPPSPTDLFVTAHAVLSSGYGRSTMTQRTFNAFGIKAGSSWKGATMTTAAREHCQNGQPAAHCAGQADGFVYPVTAKWRVYSSYDGAIRDHLTLVMKGSRYRRSAQLLAAGDLDYMEQLGFDGWYTNVPAVVGAMWRDQFIPIVRGILEGTRTLKRELAGRRLTLALVGGR